GGEPAAPGAHARPARAPVRRRAAAHRADRAVGSQGRLDVPALRFRAGGAQGGRPVTPIAPAAADGVKVSVIIVTWNTREMTLECLASVFASGTRDMEVIVVDNASSDGTSEAIRERFPDVRLIENPTNRGFAAANNQAMRVARGEYFLLLNSDTLVRGAASAASAAYQDARPPVVSLGRPGLIPRR